MTGIPTVPIMYPLDSYKSCTVKVECVKCVYCSFVFGV